MSKFPPEKTQPQPQENTTAQALRQAHFDAFFAGANAGMLIFDRQLRYVQINEVLAQMNGVCVADHIGRSVREVLPELAPTVEPMLQGILDTGKPILDYELVGETPKEPGIVRYWQASYYPLLDENGLVFGLGGIVIEISDRKRAEQKQARLTAILEATSDFVGIADATGHNVYLNKAGQKMMGVPPEEARSPFSVDFVLAPSATTKFQNEVFPTALREGSWAGETVFLSHDGKEIPVSQVLIVHKTETGEVEFISTIARDISDRKKAEEERQLLATTIENSRDFIGVASMDGRPMLLNQAGLDLVGLSSLDEARTKHITDFFMPEDLDFVQQRVLPTLMQEGGWRSDYRFRHFVTGQPIAVDYTLFLVKHPETNEPVGIATITRDIRDRKTAEDVLKQSEERFRSLIEASAQIIWICNADGEMAIEQPTWSAFTGQTFDDYKGRGGSNAIHPDDRSSITTAWLTAVANRSFYESEFRMRRYDGEYRYMSCRGVPILNADGSIREWIGANTDITDRKQAEEALREQQAVLRERNLLLSSILESTPDIIVVKDREGRYVALNSFVAKTFYGKPIEEIIGKDDSELLPTAAAFAIMAKDREIMEAGITETYEEEVFNGKENTSFLTTKAPWRDAQGNIIGLIAIARNIGDRKQAEAQMRDRNALLNSILESTPDFIVVKDREGRHVALNSNLANFIGKPIEEIIGKDDLELLPPESARAIMAKDRQVMATGITETYEEDVSDGEKTATFFTTKAPWRDGNGNILGIIATTRDISDRKKVEQTLRQTLEILDLASNSIIIRDMDDRITYWNQGAEKLYGWTKAEVVGQHIHTFLETVFPKPLETVMAEFFQQGSWEGEVEHTTRDGRHIIVASRWTLQRDGEGKPCAQLEINNDISDRKQAEDAIKQSEGRYRSLIAATSQLVWTADAEGRCVDQPGWRAYTGQTEAEMADGFGWLDAIHPDDRERTTQVWMEAVQTKSLYDTEYRIRGADGNYRYFQLRGVPILDEDGNLQEWIGTCSDIHDRKQAEDALKQSEGRYRSLIAATSQMVWITDAEGRCQDTPTFRAYTGQTVDEVVGFGWLDAIHPDDRERTSQLWMEAVQTKSLYDIEYRIRGADGNYRYFQARAVPILNEEGHIQEWIGTSSDIHDRKQAEDAIKQSEERYRSLILATSQIVWTSDFEGKCPDLPSWRAYTGQTVEEVLGFGWLDAIHPDDRERTAQAWMEAAQTKCLYDIEYRMRAADGNYRYFQVRAVPIQNEDSSIREWVGTCTDIHDRKQAEDAIKQSEERYRSLILAISQIVWTTDAEGRCQDSPSMRSYTGQTEAEGVGFGWLDTIHPDDRERTVQVWMEAVQTRSMFEMEYRMRGTDGNYRYFQARGVPLLDEDGSLREWVGTCIDIHDRKQAEIVQAKAREAAEAASRAKSEFLANMSHELRTPLNGIMGYAQILQRSKVLNEEERSRIDVIYQCGSHLLTLINDILDLSKIEAQKVELQPTDFHFPAFLQGVAEMCRIRAEIKGIHFHFPSSPELPIGIRADEKRLRQVLINLLSNAIKFTDEGSVTFIVSFATEGKIRFEIRDTGTGIAQDQLQAIFQPFEQVGDRRRQTEGTGLGLAISKRIVELMGSTIQVQSEMNVGSIFWFDVHLSQADEWVKTSQIDHRGQIIGIKDRQPKIVVIDDKWANRSVISNLLSPIGFEVFEANDGQEGWEKIIEVQPDLIVTDLLMPELDGFEVIKRVRESENFKDIIIIVSSASVFETDQYRSLEAGGNTFIPKPIQATELLQKLQQYLDLEWVYEANEEPQARSSDTDELIAPPATQMEMLYELAMKGNFLEIVKQALLLEEIDPQYIPFAKRLHQMAKDFQDEEILTFIQSYK
ncbi:MULTISPECIES: PAS domain S-box protein [unclassified Microcoleus]|uniref:PAS domain S-box protein n=1 Tax=unclassified Microcoleus TaxID=2642155 RepID=UPI002FD507AF